VNWLVKVLYYIQKIPCWRDKSVILLLVADIGIVCFAFSIVQVKGGIMNIVEIRPGVIAVDRPGATSNVAFV